MRRNSDIKERILGIRYPISFTERFAWYKTLLVNVFAHLRKSFKTFCSWLFSSICRHLSCLKLGIHTLHLSHLGEWQALTFTLPVARILTWAQMLVQILLTIFAGEERHIQCSEVLFLFDNTGGSGSFFKMWSTLP